MSNFYEVSELVKLGILDFPMDGNHGEIHPVSSDFVNKGIPFIMSSDINNGLIDYTNCRFITKEHAKKLRKGFSIKGDVLLTHKASIGRTAINNYIDDEFIMLTPQVTYYRILDTNRLNNIFLKHYFNSTYFQKIINSWAESGSTRAYIGITKQLDLPIYMPDLATQQKIVAVLSALDDKIELNNKINTKLESMAKTLYDYWFVQFEFPNAEGKPYKSSGGAMEYNPILKREIPKGWEVKRLEELVEVKDGTHDSPKYINDNGYPLVTSKNLKKSGIDFNDTNKISKIDFDLINQRSKVDTGDILFSMIGNIGTIYKVEEKEIGFAIKNVALFKTSRNLLLKNFIFQYLHSYDMQRYLPNEISGSIQKFVGLGSLRNTPILYNTKVIDEFTKVSTSIFERIDNNIKQNQELAQLRDWLLPMLMNGQVKVDDVEDRVLGMVAEPREAYQKTTVGSKEERFELWLGNQSLAARGDINEVVLREIFDAMDEEDQ